MTQEEMLVLMKTDPAKGMQLVTGQYAALVYKVVWGRLSSLCTAEDVEETVSDVFVDFYKKYHTVDLSKGSLASFLITLAQRRAVDEFRRIMRQKNIENMLNEKEDSPSCGTDTVVLEKEERELLLQAIISLGEPDSTIIYRRFYYGETYAQIGDKLGISENAANKRCLRAIEKLGLLMKGENNRD